MRSRYATIVSGLLLLASPVRARAQRPSEPLPGGTLDAATEVEVRDTPLREEVPVSPYGQPAWTIRRPFVVSRVYVLPAWTFAAELGYDVVVPDEGKAGSRLTQELELGLPFRLQLDYEAREQNYEKGPGGVETGPDAEDDMRFDSQSVELRWAVADWGVVPLNPTLFGEWSFHSEEADEFELKVLGGDEIAPRWHGVVNLFFEQQVGDEREREIAVSGSVSYALVDERVAVGVESKLTFEKEEEENGEEGNEAKFQIGPSLSWRPVDGIHVDAVPLFGATEWKKTPPVQAFVFVGFDYDLGGERHEVAEPAGTRTR